MIFEKAVAGINTHGIASILNEKKIPAPGMFKQRSRRIVSDDEYLWDIQKVYMILKNYSYTDSMVQGKTKSLSVGNASKCCKENHDAKKIQSLVAGLLSRQMRMLELLEIKIQEKRDRKAQCLDIATLRRKTESEIEILKAEKVRIYESYVEGTIKKEEYLRKKDKIACKIEMLTESLKKAEDSVAEENELINGLHTTSNEYMKLKSNKPLTKEVVQAMIESVIIYDEQTIEIKFKFEDIAGRALQYLGSLNMTE